MPLLSTSEALHVSDSFLLTLYGDDTFRRWKELKDDMKFLTEREYVSWLIDVANHYRNEDESQQLSQEANTNQFTTSNVKSEEGLDHYNQGQGQSYETPVSEHSHLSSTQDTRNSKSYHEQFTVDTKVEGAGNSNQQTSVTSQGAGNSNEQTSVTSQVDEYKYEQSYYDDVREDDRMLEMERNEEILLSSDDEDEGDGEASGTMDDGNEYGTIPRATTHDPATSLQSNDRFSCPHCAYTTKQGASILNRHILAIHEKLKPFSCQYCSYSCSQKVTLEGHLIRKHGYQSKYCCDKCGKYFQLPSHCYKHIKICKINS